MNICIFKGWVQDKPELKLTSTGKKVTRFDIAVPRKFRGADGKKEYDYITVEAWESRAEFCERWLNKGSEVVVESELRIDKYTDKDGNKRSRHIYALNGIEFCGSAQTAQNAPIPANDPAYGMIMGAPAYSQQTAVPVGYEEVADDGDIPF